MSHESLRPFFRSDRIRILTGREDSAYPCNAGYAIRLLQRRLRLATVLFACWQPEKRVPLSLPTWRYGVISSIWYRYISLLPREPKLSSPCHVESHGLELSADLCRALATMSRLDVELEILCLLSFNSAKTCDSTDNQRSTINDQRSTINDQRSTINDQRSTINDQQSTINNQQSTIND
jgi:hypothetical protein